MHTILAFLLTIGILVSIHEYGHFQVARWCGIKVLRFSLGFGTPIYRRHFGQDHTEFVISVLPLGGYVKMLDEREIEEVERAQYTDQDWSRAFNRQSVWKRMLVVLAGPLANLLLAIFLYWLLFIQGEIGLKPIISTPEHNTPAALAGLQNADQIKKVGSVSVQTWQDMEWQILQQGAGKTVLPLTIQHAHGNKTNLMLDVSKLNIDAPDSSPAAQLGFVPYQPEMPPVIGQVMKDSAAERAGLFSGDRVTSINQQPIQNWSQVVTLVKSHPNKKLIFEIQRGSTHHEIAIVPEMANEGGEHIGRIGVAYQLSAQEKEKFLVKVHYTATQALVRAAQKTWDTSLFSLQMLWNMVVGKASWSGLSGPVTIASYAGESATLGLNAYLGFLAVVSISLGILNLLPIPVLDGGHLMYYIAELLKGSAVSEYWQALGQRVGMTLLMILMACAMYNDIARVLVG